MPILFECSFLEFLAVRDEAHHLRLLRPGGARVGDPEVPVRLEDVGVIGMQQVADDLHRVEWSDAGRKASLQNGGLCPRNRVDCYRADTRAQSRERKLLEDRQRARHHGGLVEVREPQAEKERVGHGGFGCAGGEDYCALWTIVNVRSFMRGEATESLAPGAGFCYDRSSRKSRLERQASPSSSPA